MPLGAATTATAAATMDKNELEVTCTTCAAVKFENKEAKRNHMRDDWQWVSPVPVNGISTDSPSVYNLKRKIANLGPISSSTYWTQVRKSPSEESDVSDSSSAHHSLSNSEDEHSEELSDEHYDKQDEDKELDVTGHGAVRLGDELRLASGKILSHRSSHRPSRRHRSRAAHSPSPELQQLTESAGSDESRMESVNAKDHRLALRKGTETSLIGLPEQQQRALRATEEKIEAVERRARNEYQSGVERGGNKQKRFKVQSIGKKAGGLEKRLG